MGAGARAHAGCTAERPENEVHPLIDNGFHVYERRLGGLYKIDARAPIRRFVWVNDGGVRHEGNLPRTRGIALWRISYLRSSRWRVIAVQPRFRRNVWTRRSPASTNSAPRNVSTRTPYGGRQGAGRNGAAGGGTRGWLAALDARTATNCGAGTSFRHQVSPAAKPGKTRTTPGRPAAAGCGRPGLIDPVTKLTIWGTAIRFRTTIRCRARGTISTPIQLSRSISIPASSPGISIYAERLVGL